MELDQQQFFKKKINELGLVLKNGAYNPTGEGRFWKLKFKTGDTLEFEWQSLSVVHERYKEVWIEYDKAKGGLIFDLRDFNDSFTLIVIVKNEDIESE